MAGDTICWAWFDVCDVRKTCRRVAVTIQTRGHGERGYLLYHVHVLYVTMAILAPDPGIDMKAVTEINIIRKFMNTLPWYRFVFIIIISKPYYFGACFHGDRVTIHASAWRWYNCKPGSVDSDVTVCTIDSHSANMQFVRKGYRLCWCISYAFSHRPRYEVCYCDRTQCDKYEDGNANPQRVFQKGSVHRYSLTKEISEFVGCLRKAFGKKRFAMHFKNISKRKRVQIFQ